MHKKIPETDQGKTVQMPVHEKYAGTDQRQTVQSQHVTQDQVESLDAGGKLEAALTTDRRAPGLGVAGPPLEALSELVLWALDALSELAVLCLFAGWIASACAALTGPLEAGRTGRGGRLTHCPRARNSAYATKVRACGFNAS